MAYLQTSDFKLGMDRTRERYVGTPGALWTLKNGHITRGGDIERAKKFVPALALPPGTFGLTHVAGQLYTFGSADLASKMPAGVVYQRLQAADGSMSRLLDARTFDGKLYVVAEFDDGSINHFYNGARVPGWDDIANQNTSQTALAAYLADKVNTRSDVRAVVFGRSIRLSAASAGVGFDVSAAFASDGGQTVTVLESVPNVPAVAAARATGRVTILSGAEGPDTPQILAVRVGDTSLTTEAVDWSTSNETTALLLQRAINNQTANHGYSAEAQGAVVTLTAPPGAAANGLPVSVDIRGLLQVSTAEMQGGVAEVTPVAQVSVVTLGGIFSSADTLVLTINGTIYRARGLAAGAGTYAHVWKKKLWSPANSLYAYSDVDNPANFAPNSETGGGGGFINMANQTEGSERLVAAAEYSGNVAIFARRSVRIWTLDADPTRNAFLQTLENTGTVAPKSVQKYGNQDVFYLSDSGIRSIRARDSSNAAVAEDVGTRIDPFIQEHFRGLTPDQQARAVGIVEPIDGRYLLALGGRVYVFSYFPALKISAWSFYEPGFEISDFVRSDRQLYARSGDTIYLYGGARGDEYPAAGELELEVETPFLSAGTPATIKSFFGFDLACLNEWRVEMLLEPSNPEATTEIGRINETTYNQLTIPTAGRGGVFALRMTCDQPGRAVLSSVADHFASQEAR